MSSSQDFEVYRLVEWAMGEQRERTAKMHADGTWSQLKELGVIWAIGGEILDRAAEIRKHHTWSARIRRWFRVH